MKKINLIFCLMLLMVSTVYSMDIEIGTGNGTTSRMPFYGYYNYSWSNFIINSDLIGMEAEFNKIQFNLSNELDNYSITNQKIYFKHTTDTLVPAEYQDPETAGFTLVYDGDITLNGSGWQGVVLDTPFDYNYTDNLQIIWENKDGSFVYDYPIFYTTEIGTSVGALNYADSAFPAETGEVVTYLPNLKLGFEAENEPSLASLLAPANASANIATTTTLQWTLGENTTDIDVYFSNVASDVTTMAASTMVIDGQYITSYEAAGLENLTTYFWRVKSRNSANGLVVASPIWSFTTEASGGLVSVPIGSGSASYNRYPLNFYYKNSVAETIYLAEELNISGQIHGLTYYTTFETDLTAKPINIWIGETDQADLSTYIPASDLTAIFSGTVDFPTGQNSINITFDTPYNYTGGNLVVLTEREFDEEYYSINDKFYSTATELPNRTIYWQNDLEDLDPETVTEGTASTNMPNVTFYFNVEGMGSLAGTVTDGTSGLDGVTLIINGTNYQTRTSADGSFEFPYILAGEDYSLTASFPDYYDKTINFIVVENEESQINLVLDAISFVTVTGQITSGLTDTGIPATISLAGISDYSTIADSLGNYTIESVYSNNNYTLNISYLGYDTLVSNLLVDESDLIFDAVLADITVPNNLTARVSNGIVNLTWDAIDNQDRAWLGYNVYRDEVLLNNEPLISTNFYDDGVILGATNSYFVTSILDEGESTPSNPVEIFIVDYEGYGSEEQPYLIEDLADLQILSENSSLWNSDYYYEQTANIDASETQTWNNAAGFSPIGNFSTQFKASFNGNNYSISNLYINRPSSIVVGFFGYTSGSNISNITLVDNEIIGQHYVGGLVAYASNSSSINNCSVTGSVTGTGTQIGGLVGYSTATIINNSFATGAVSGTSNIGGLVGKSTNTSALNNCYATGDVTGTGDLVGGLIGLSNSQLNYSYASGLVTGGGANVGGLVGGSSSSSVTNSFWDINTTNQASSAGGSGLTTSEMQTLSTYIDANWDFQAETSNGTDDIWVFYDNHYPRLSWDRFISPDFTVNQNTIFSGSTIEFTNTSIGEIDEFFWEFGDGNTSNETNPSHTYSSSGIYSITLNVSNANSNVSITKTDYILVNPAADISVNPMEVSTSIPTDDTSIRYLTISNNGEEMLNASLNIGATRMRSGIPEFIYGKTTTSSGAIDSGLNTSRKLIPNTKRITSSRTGGYSILYVNTLQGNSSDLTTAVSNLSNVSQFDQSDASEGTTTLEYMQQYDIVIVASNQYFSSPTTMGNNLAAYSDAGGKLIILNASMCSGGDWALAGAIIGPEYMPLATTDYYIPDDPLVGTNFISHPITNNVSTISTNIYAKTYIQGDGVSLGSYPNGYPNDYPIAAYSSTKPIVAINVFPKNDSWDVDGDLVQMISNTIDWFADPYEWLTISETDISIAPGSSETIELTLSSQDLEANIYTKTINISSNDPDEPTINIPVTLNVVQILDAQFSADNTEVLSGQTIQFTDLTTGNPNHWRWYLDNDLEADSYLQNPSFTYDSNGTYSISLVASYLDENDLLVTSDSVTYSDYISVSGTSMSAGSYSGTWELAQSPFNIYGQITIDPGTTLTIEAGVVLNFMSDTDFVIAGQLLANSVLLTSSGTDAREIGVWQGVKFTSSSSISSLTNSVIENATKGIEITDSSPILRGLEIKGMNREFPAIKISGSSNAVLEDLDIDDFDNGVEILGEDSDHTPVITNIRVRHTTNSRLSSGIGIKISGPANIQMTNSLIEGFATGLQISGNNSSNITRNALINNTIAIDLSGAECIPQIHHNHLENESGETATSFAINNTVGIQILNNNILGFSSVVTGENSSPYFSQNIIWGTSIQADQLSLGTNLNSIFEYNNISMESGLAPGAGNMNFDPLFVDEDSYNLELSIQSECIDAGNPSLDSDPDGSVADLGMNYIHHLVDFDSTDRFSNSGTIVEFENKSQGHDESSTTILWEFGDGDSSIERNPIHLYGIPGTYNVTLTMTTGSYSDVLTRESFIIVQGQALSAPQNPTISLNGSNMELTWEEVTESASGTPTSNVVYFIYSCDNPLGTYNYRANVTSLNWTDENIMQEADKQFYFIIAYPSSTRVTSEDFINTHRYMTRDGEVLKQQNSKKTNKKK